MSPLGRCIAIVFEKAASLNVLLCLEDMHISLLLVNSSLQNQMERQEGVIQSPKLFFYLPLCLLGLGGANRSSPTESPCPPQARPAAFPTFLLRSKTLSRIRTCHISVQPIWTPQRESSVGGELQRSAAEDFNPSAICAELITGGSKFKRK